MSSVQQKTVRNRILTALAPEDFALLQQKLEPVQLEFRQIILEPGDPIRHVYFIERGITSVLADASEGRVEIGMIGSEGMIGLPVLLGSKHSPFAFMVQAGGEALRIPASEMLAAYQQTPGINAAIGRFIHAFMVQTAQTAYANATLNVEARLARWILMTQDRLGQDELPLTHDFLSMMLAVRRAGVTTSTHILEGAGMIRATRGQIKVLDRERLTALTDNTYGLAEAEYERLLAAG
jgi:CRP-like cAMP-binding protein